MGLCLHLCITPFLLHMLSCQSIEGQSWGEPSIFLYFCWCHPHFIVQVNGKTIYLEPGTMSLILLLLQDWHQRWLSLACSYAQAHRQPSSGVCHCIIQLHVMVDLLSSSSYCFAIIVFSRRVSLNPRCSAGAQEKRGGWLWHEHSRKKERQCQAECEAWF